MSMANRVFWIVQALLKYAPFDWCVALRRTLYTPCFARAGIGLAVHDNVLIKYPDQITVGDHVTINAGCIVVGLGGLSIGSHVMIGAGTKIVTTRHVMTRTDVPMRLQGLAHTPITIEDDVWFGFDVAVMPGAIIRRGAVIGAGSVVTDEIPEYAIAVGTPARVVGSRKA
jgi:acetyltransferase-like isoleucine patch superfamily enzyme